MSELGRRIFPLRGYLGVPFLLTMLWFCQPDPGLHTGSGWVLLLLGLGMRLWGVAGWVPRRLPPNAGEHLILEDGPYVYTRNPRYLGNLLLGLGGCVLAGLKVCLLPYFLLWACIHVPIVAHEEHSLAQRYGSAYLEYCARVPRFLGIPGRSLLPQILPLRWDLAFCLEMSTIAGWLSLGAFLQVWRAVQLGASPALYVGSILAAGLCWIGLSALAQRLRKKLARPDADETV